MKKILQLSNFLSSLGTEDNMDLLDKKRIMLTNKLSILGAILLLVSTAITAKDADINGLLRLLSPVPFIILPLVLNYYKKTEVAKYILMFVLFYIVSYSGAKFSDASEKSIASSQLLTVMMIVMPFLLFDFKKHKLSIILFLGLIIIAFFSTPYLHQTFKLANTGINEQGKDFYLDFIAPAIVFVVLISSFFSSQVLDLQIIMNLLEQTKDFNQKLEKQVKDRTNQLQETNEELSQTNEELSSTIEVVNEQKELIQHKNKHITDSINYAARIQKAILGDAEKIEKNFAEAFVFFKPHSIVSGDFYWFTKIPEKGIKIIAAADCTGHGVPGAFMTVMGHDFLEEIVKNKGITMPDEILTELDKKVTERLKQNSKQQVNDGMDITILTVNDLEKTVYFSGAKNPLFYVQNEEMHIIKGSKLTIGGIQTGSSNHKEFERHTIQADQKTTFYLFSDGFQDQFGYENNRKYLTLNFRNLLHRISSVPLHLQKEQLEDELNAWKKNIQQTDDILVIGIKI